MPSPFHRPIPVRFGDCDPAGIVYYPRYVEMFNNLVEDWCEFGLGCSMQHLIQVQKLGLPTANLQVDFVATSRWGETLNAELAVLRLGNSSVTVQIHLRGPDHSERVRAQLVLVLMDFASGRGTTIPDDLRQRIQQFQPEQG
jgi:4-hydroxybenzoyl-CoA thioesterase